jgi:hypothetical protein
MVSHSLSTNTKVITTWYFTPPRFSNSAVACNTGQQTLNNVVQETSLLHLVGVKVYGGLLTCGATRRHIPEHRHRRVRFEVLAEVGM